jgi:hypothetical protein
MSIFYSLIVTGTGIDTIRYMKGVRPCNASYLGGRCRRIMSLRLFWAKILRSCVKNTRCWWLTPVIPATQEAEIRRIAVQSQPGQIVFEILSRKNLSQKWAGGVAHVVRAPA